MNSVGVIVIFLVLVALLAFALSARIVKQYEDGVLFRLGRVIGERKPGYRMIIPIVDVMHRVSWLVVHAAVLLPTPEP